jgi:phosphatidylethanolamine N-methyltransferase
MQGKLLDGASEPPSPSGGSIDWETAFDIPQTRNVLTSLLGAHVWQSSAHLAIAASLALQLLVFCSIPLSWSRWIFLGYFLLWRAAYNAGLGYVLHKQSTDRWLVKYAQGYQLFDADVHPRLNRWLGSELQAGLVSRYDMKVGRRSRRRGCRDLKAGRAG